MGWGTLRYNTTMTQKILNMIQIRQKLLFFRKNFFIFFLTNDNRTKYPGVTLSIMIFKKKLKKKVRTFFVK